MRPKKPILLYCSDQESLAATAFVLRLYPYDVATVSDGSDAAAMIAGKDAAFCCGVLIHSQQGDLAGRVIHRLLETNSHVPLLLVDSVGDLAPQQYADMVLYGRNTTMTHILAALQVLCRRKRGPKPWRAA
jgi:hypothetical protein